MSTTHSLDSSSGLSGPAPSGRRRAAEVVSEVVAPWVLAAVLPIVIGALTADSPWRGGALGALLALFSSAVPAWLVGRAIKAGRAEDRDVRDRRQRPALLAATGISVAVGLGLAWWLDAPRALFALVAAMLAGMVVAASISLFWKISLHVGVAAGSVAVLAVVAGPWAWLLLVAVVAVAWSRLELTAHTPAQVVVGALVGAAVAGAVMVALV